MADQIDHIDNRLSDLQTECIELRQKYDALEKDYAEADQKVKDLTEMNLDEIAAQAVKLIDLDDIAEVVKENFDIDDVIDMDNASEKLIEHMSGAELTCTIS